MDLGMLNEPEKDLIISDQNLINPQNPFNMRNIYTILEHRWKILFSKIENRPVVQQDPLFQNLSCSTLTSARRGFSNPHNQHHNR